MLHISGKNDLLKDLMEKEGFEGSLMEYGQKFNKMNHQLGIKIANSHEKLPPFTPVFPVLQPIEPDSQQYERAREVGQYSRNERQILREMQEQDIDIPLLVPALDLLKDYSSQLSTVRKKLDDPIIQTPWKFWNQHITWGKVPDMISQGSFYKANSIQYSPLFRDLKVLEKDMLAMDTLQTKLHSMRHQKGYNALTVRQQLQTQIRNLSPRIKQQIYPKIETDLSKHMAASYDPLDLKKMTRSSFGEKMARKGKLKTTQLNFATRTGLSRMRAVIPLFQNIGAVASKSSTCIGWASLGYDTLDAALEKDLLKAIRTATAGTAGIFVGASVTTYIIGTAGTTFLVATPFGWAIVVLGGIVAGSYAGSKAKEIVENKIDNASNFLNKYYPEGLLNTIFMSIGQSMLEN